MKYALFTSLTVIGLAFAAINIAHAARAADGAPTAQQQTTTVNATAEQSTFELRPETLITEWLVCGPFAGGAGTDYLAEAGGEGKADLATIKIVPFQGKDYPVRRIAVNAKANISIGGCMKNIPMFPEEKDTLNLSDLPEGKGVYYLCCHITTPHAGRASLLFQTGGARLWFNQTALDLDLCDNWSWRTSPKHLDTLPVDQPYDAWQENFETVAVPLRAGANSLLVKVLPLKNWWEGGTERCMARFTLAPTKPGAGKTSELGQAKFLPTPAHPIGDRGDGTGVFPGARPPVFWDEAAGVNVRWRTPMPSSAKGGPIVVGDRVFTLADPNLLVCCDAGTGKVRWQRTCDQLELLDADTAVWARKEWSELNGHFLRVRALNAEYQWLTGKGSACWAAGIIPNKPLDDRPATTARAAAILDELRALGGWQTLPAGSEGVGHDISPYPLSSEALKQFTARAIALRDKAGYYFPYTMHWNYRGFCNATPCSDGRYVYAYFGAGLIACFDLDGKRKWMMWSPIDYGSQTEQLYQHAGGLVSPYLYQGRLIIQAGGTLRVLDADNGKLVWEQPFRSEVYQRSPVMIAGQARPMILGKQTVLISPCGRVYRFSDGKILMDADGFKLYTGRTDKDFRSVWFCVTAGTPAINGDIAYFGFPNGVRAMKFKFASEDKVVTEQQWVYELSDKRFTGKESVLWSTSHETTVFFDESPLFDPATGRIWFGVHKTGEIEILDAATGKALQEGTTNYWLSEGRGCAVAGNLIFAHRGHGATQVYASEGSLAPLADNAVLAPAVRDSRERKMTWAEWKAKWFDHGWTHIGFAGGSTSGELFFHGDCVYMRTDEALICLQDGAKAIPTAIP